ncbi:MAG: TIGR03086 family metal-binding protein [Acidimicrobiia bacterium]
MADTTNVRRVADQLDGLIGGVQDSQLGLPTPCTEWDVRALLDHVTGGGLLFATCIRDGACSDEYLMKIMTEDQVGNDPVASFRAASSSFLSAADAADADRVVATPWGEMPVSVVLDIAVADLTIHSIDLALATGADLDELDLELLARADELAHQYFPSEGRPPVFGPPVEVTADRHPALQLAAFAGRTV